HRVHIAPDGQSPEFVLHILDRLVAGVDRVVSAVLLCHGELFVAAGERHHGGAAAQQSGVLHGVAAEAADTVDDDRAACTELACVPSFLHPAVGRQSCICQRRKDLGLLVGIVRRTDDIAVRYRHGLCKSTWRPEAQHCSVGADLLVAFVTLPTHPVAPVGVDYDQIALGWAGGARNVSADRGDPARDLMPWRRRKRQWSARPRNSPRFAESRCGTYLLPPL